MYNLKLTAYVAGAGFVLSILVGLFSGVGFGVLLIRALFCSALCGIVVSIGYVLYKKYLDTDIIIRPLGADAEQKGKSKGNLVNIVLDDTPLPDDDSAPDFIIDKEEGQKVHLSSDTEETEVVSAETSENDQNFIAQPIAAVAKSTEAELLPVDEKKTNESEIVSENDEASSLQDLPDIENIMGDISSDLNGIDSSNITEESDFARTGDSKPKTEEPASATSANTEELAKAIRTVMAKDN